MITKRLGKRMMEEVVERYSQYMRLMKSQVLGEGCLSEQDITTKFVLPFLASLNWSIYEVGMKGPEVHEKAFREKSNVGKGLPDIVLKSNNGTVFVEVKKPPLRSQGTSNLERYNDSDLIVLTSFNITKLYSRYKVNKPRLRFEFNVEQYVPEFDAIWHVLSNTDEGKQARAGYKATR